MTALIADRQRPCQSDRVRVGILGPLEVECEGRRVGVAGARLQRLLIALALKAGTPVSSVALADAIWDGDQPADEQHALQSLVSRLRRVLGDSELIAQSAGGYLLALDPDRVDSLRFERLAAAGAGSLRDGDPQGADRLLRAAIALWRGPALGQLAPQALAADAARLEDLRVAACADRAEAELALGGGPELVGELTELADAHPLHERVTALLIRALFAAGRQADALVVYERVRRLLDDELGASPSPELQGAHMAVLRGEQHAAAPSPRDGSRTNLPAMLTSFVGREQELRRLEPVLEEHRLVTLVGAGGAGKTRLATEVAGQAAGYLRDGVWMVELAPVADPDGTAVAVAESMGLRELQLLGNGSALAGSSLAGLDRLLELLAERRTLLVLDNCEHLLEPVAELVDQVLRECPGVRIICTSREPLGITGETIVTVAPLALPDEGLSVEAALTVPAVRLFADRARAAAGFELDEGTVEAVIDVCRRVDGLPLAIELAAARLRSMTLPQLAARLDDRFRLLTGGSRTALPRQRTLRAVVDWSWDLLDEPERALLRRVSTFPGGATLEAAEAVCAGGAVAIPEVFDLLSNLIDRSLLQISSVDGPRYRMLETIREYGLERAVEADELVTTRESHARYYSELAMTAAEHLRGAEQLTWLARLRADHDNILAALRQLGDAGDAAGVAQTVTALLWFWMLSGSREEVMGWIEFARSLPGEVDPLNRVLIDAVHSLARAIPGGPPEVGDPWQALAQLLERIEDADLSEQPLLAAVRPLLALAVGRERVLELLELSAAHPDAWVRATVPFVRVQMAENDGDLAKMRTALDEAIAAFTKVGDRWGLATTLSERSSLLILDGDLDGAEDAIKLTQALLAELGTSAIGGMVQLRLADIRIRRGDLEGAVELLLARLEERESYSEETAMLKVAAAHAIALQGDLDRARTLVGEALTASQSRAQRAEQGHVLAMALYASAWLEIEVDELHKARELLVETRPVALGTNDMPLIAAGGTAVAALARSAGHPLDSAEMLGAGAKLRGSEDPTHPDVARLAAALRDELGREGFEEAYARGRQLSRDDAIARLDPALVDLADQD